MKYTKDMKKCSEMINAVGVKNGQSPKKRTTLEIGVSAALEILFEKFIFGLKVDFQTTGLLY
ncbi:hypothetical protein [Methanosarcina barkeri]|uniref:Uncharacterized protein n=1 Tax=Methanosarcina barkeri CM1 TaxID=796385 RepID=A0A0G3C7B6_METBA|nr:hypothetical protein [Methanosarcina barkeri]AKJ37871.1 hypothetical protein MCM1_0793 [Methanosarcina barkeri CM1]